MWLAIYGNRRKTVKEKAKRERLVERELKERKGEVLYLWMVTAMAATTMTVQDSIPNLK